jgi:hypothetical protein
MSDVYPNPASTEMVRQRHPQPRVDPFTSHRLQRGSEHLGQLGGLPATLGLLAEYERRLTPAMLRLAGGDRFPTRQLRAVPR